MVYYGDMPDRGRYNLNGMKKSQPRGAEYVTRRINRKEYLKTLHDRLEGEVGFLLNVLSVRNKREPHVGFFSMVRAIMPIIESVASTEGRPPQELLADLGFGAPYIAWNLYRDVFLHNDEFVIAVAGKAGVPSGIIFTDKDGEELSDELAGDGMTFDPARTYRELLRYLDGQISEANETDEVDIISEIHYDLASDEDEVKNAIKDINNIHKRAVGS